MSKIRSNSIWNSLPPERREQFDQWLFVEHVSYNEARTRAKQEWNVSGSVTSVSRYYWRVLGNREVDEMAGLQETAEVLRDSGVNPETLRTSAMKLIGKRLLKKTMEEGDVKELATLGRLLNDAERRQIQRERLALSRERFEFNAAEAALAELPNAEAMAQEDLERERARVRSIREHLFGPDLALEGGGK